MVLILFALLGFFVGYWLEMTRIGYLTMGLTALMFSGGQIAILFFVKSREAVTMLPLVVGLALDLFMLLGAIVRLPIRNRASAV